MPHTETTLIMDIDAHSVTNGLIEEFRDAKIYEYEDKTAEEHLYTIEKIWEEWNENKHFLENKDHRRSKRTGSGNLHSKSFWRAGAQKNQEKPPQAISTWHLTKKYHHESYSPHCCHSGR